MNTSSPTCSGSTAGSARPKLSDGMLLAAIGTLGHFAANTYVPAFGEIARDLAASPVAVQQSLSIYLAGFAVASLFIGAVSDAFGRKRVLMIATLAFAAASLAAMSADSIEALCLWRLVMGVTASAGPVLSQAIVRDRWQGVDAARIVALIAVLFGVGPCLAPILGGEITVTFGWRGVFLFLAALGTGLCALAGLLLKETLPAERRVSFRPLVTLSRYGEALRSLPFVAGILAHGFCFMGLIVYSAGAADFVIHVLGLEVDEFGWMMVPIVLASMAGAWAGPKVLERTGAKRLIAGGMIALIASGLAGALVERFEPLDFPLLLLPPVAYNFFAAMIRPTINVMNLDYFPRSRGLAASLQQASLTGAFGISSAALVPLVMGEAWRYSVVMLLSGAAALALWSVVLATRARALPEGAERL